MEPGTAVKIGIEAEDRSNSVALHDCDVKGISSREPSPIPCDFGGAKYICFFDRNHLIDNLSGDVKCRGDSFPLADRRVAVHDFLKDFGVSDQSFSGRDQAFQNDLRFGLVGMGSANQIHRNIGIDKD